MIWPALMLFLLGLFLSAFFSGSETGFYRVTRIRLALDASDGDLISNALLQLTNRPALFVATTLIGNNLANYLTSLSIVLLARSAAGSSAVAELAAPLAMTPVVFVYGELLPKNLFFYAPNLLLRRAGPLLLLFTLLLAPIALVLWALGAMLQVVLGQTPLRVQLQLARQELQQVLREGGEAGILRPVQQQLSEGLLSVAAQPAARLGIPRARLSAVPLGAAPAEALRLARTVRRAAVAVQNDDGSLAGYVRVVDLCLNTERTELQQHLRPLPAVSSRSSHLAALIHLQTENEEMARLVDDQDQTEGVAYASDLAAPFFEQ